MGYEVVFFNHRNQGQSSRETENKKITYIESFDVYANDLVTFFDKVVFPKASGRNVYLMAHSMGGLVAPLAALKIQN